jgi:hypothetical protein
MKIKHFYNPKINSPSDFDWGKTKVCFNLNHFKILLLPELLKIENDLFNNLSKIISSDRTIPYVYDEEKELNVQQLINLLCDVREYIDKK